MLPLSSLEMFASAIELRVNTFVRRPPAAAGRCRGVKVRGMRVKGGTSERLKDGKKTGVETCQKLTAVEWFNCKLFHRCSLAGVGEKASFQSGLTDRRKLLVTAYN